MDGSQHDTTLVIGGTGRTGRRVAERLTRLGRPARIGSRSADSPFDWEDPSTWKHALQGTAAAYISYYPDLAVPGAPEAIGAFSELAVAAGTRRLVLLSGRGEEEAQEAEEEMAASGADWTVVRASWSAQNFDEDYLLDQVRSGQVALPAGDVGEPFIDVDDIADRRSRRARPGRARRRGLRGHRPTPPHVRRGRGHDRRRDGPFDRLRHDPGGHLRRRDGHRRIQLQVTVGTGWGQAGVVAPETLAQLTDSPEARVIWIRASASADPMQLVGDLDELTDPVGAEVDDELQAGAHEDQQLAILTWSVVGLLGISVAIALIGIANTLGLSVLERAREHAMLRALGLTRRQLRRMLAAEATLLAVVATLLGTVIGVGFAWVGHETVVTTVLTDATLHIPWPSLGVVVLIAALAGLLAAVLPARRAARVTPAAGLSLDG